MPNFQQINRFSQSTIYTSKPNDHTLKYQWVKGSEKGKYFIFWNYQIWIYYLPFNQHLHQYKMTSNRTIWSIQAVKKPVRKLFAKIRSLSSFSSQIHCMGNTLFSACSILGLSSSRFITLSSIIGSVMYIHWKYEIPQISSASVIQLFSFIIYSCSYHLKCIKLQQSIAKNG